MLVFPTGDSSFNDVVGQQWSFGGGVRSETQIYRLALDGIIEIRLSVNLDIRAARAWLARLRAGSTA